MEITYTCRNFHEKEELAVDTTIGLKYVIDTPNTRDDSYFMEVNEFEKYIFIGGMFGHYLYKGGNFIYLFPIEGDNLLFPSLYSFPERCNLKKEHDKDEECNTYRYK